MYIGTLVWGMVSCASPPQCPTGEVRVAVTSLLGERVMDAQVELAEHPCPEVAFGVYRCDVSAGGSHRLMVSDPRWQAFVQDLRLPMPTCGAKPVEVDVLLVRDLSR